VEVWAAGVGGEQNGRDALYVLEDLHTRAERVEMSRDERKRVLVVDDEARFRMLAQAALDPEFVILEAENGREGLRIFHEQRPDVVVLDAMMPEMDGWETLRRIRDLADTPVIMLTALDSDQDIVRGLHAGADDYITKPVSPTVLAAWIRAALRRAAQRRPAEDSRLHLDGGKLVIDRAAGRVWVRGQEVELSRTEYRLLVTLAEHAGQVLSPEQILERVWGPGYGGEIEYVKNYVRLLRAKVEENPRMPRYIVSRRGLGYMLVRTPSD
jgi:two-component system KDP operon response regulator KdpE